MSIKHISKRIMVANPPSWKEIERKEEQPVVVASAPKNKKEKKEDDMTIEQMERAAALAKNVNAPKEVKVVKKDKGLIERTESSKIVLTEDNRQVLND